MINPIAFIYNATPEDEELAIKWLKLSEVDIKIFNLPTYDPKYLVKPYGYVITFGSLARNTIEEYCKLHNLKQTKLYTLPAIKKLIKVKENIDSRKEAIETIELFKEEYTKEAPFVLPDLTLTKEDLPELYHNQLLLLNKIMTESMQSSCICTSKNGKMIEVLLHPYQERNPKADISITVSELYTVRITMEILGVNEVTLANHFTSNINASSLQDIGTHSYSNFEKNKS